MLHTCFHRRYLTTSPEVAELRKNNPALLAQFLDQVNVVEGARLEAEAQRKCVRTMVVIFVTMIVVTMIVASLLLS